MTIEISSDQARKICDPATLGLASTADIQPSQGIIGQARAVEALQFGLGIKDAGFNIFVSGSPGTGRRTAIESFLSEVAKGQPTPPDLCYVYNFQDPYRPHVLSLPPGRGRTLQEDMLAFIRDARSGLQRAFESEEYTRRHEQFQTELEQRREAAMTELGQEAHDQGFAVQSTPWGFIFIPLIQGHPATEQEFLALPEADQQHMQRIRQGLEEELKNRMKLIRQYQQEAHEAFHTLNSEVVHSIVSGLIEDIEEKYADLPDVHDYLHAVEEDMLSNVEQFLSSRSNDEQQPATPPAAGAPAAQDFFERRYTINLMVSRSDHDGAPVIHELNASYFNLFGRIEKEAFLGALHTDFTLIRPGSLHEANGGYLVVSIQELFTNPLSYDALKRAIKHREISIEDPMERLALVATRTIKPEPVSLDLKVVLVGSTMHYHMLYNLDEDFRELFRVKADFDSRMDRTPETINAYCTFLCNLREKDGVHDFTAAAVAKVVEYGSRLAEDQEKLSTRFADLADIAREANYWAEREEAGQIGVQHVQKAITQRVYRSNLVEEHIQEAIEKNLLLVDVDGTEAGQVNGLSVIDMGSYSFGRPSRITATVGIGQGGVVDIEREAKLGGPIHTKGVLILSGYMVDRFAQQRPLSLSSRLVFEQSYEGVEGDSASSAELYALLTALAGTPISQAIAVTGSINQRGEVQAIGGVNQKIEGFFDVCKAKGLTGKQGVMIPQANVRNLMLREDVTAAIQLGEFHVWAVENIAQGIELLTGMPAGERQADGSYPQGTLFNLAQTRLVEMSEQMQRFGVPGQDGRQSIPQEELATGEREADS